jgi:uncharacterized membrane protein
MKANKKAAVATEPAGARAQRIILIAVAVLALVGVAETVYLTALHLAGAHVVCLAAANCSQVLSSSYASFKGFPLAALGALGYFTVFSLSTLALFRYRRAMLFLALTVVAMFLGTLWLLYVQAFILKAFCDYCLFSAALVFLLAGLLIATPPKREA